MIDLNSLPNACETAGSFIYALAYRAGEVRSPLPFLVANNLPSQYMRMIVARALNLSSWDWRDNPNLSQIEQLIDDGLAKVISDF
jgi:hypothetical protein